jgi:uncharacterized protein with PQ loop repeat
MCAVNIEVIRMKNKVLIGTVITALISVAILIWYFSGIGVSIVSIIVPYEVGTQDSGYVTIILQNNASRDINVTLNVRNAIEDEKGVSLSTPILIVDTSRQPSTCTITSTYFAYNRKQYI